MAYRSFQVIARAKLVNFAILVALFHYNSLTRSCYYSIKPSNNTITRILAKDAILKREQLCAHITHDYNSDV